MMNLNGLFLPITTPFTATEEIDVQGLIQNISRWNKSGIAGYAVLGSTGERTHLDEREYLQVIEAAREAVPENLTFMVGAGQQSTRGTIKEINQAAAAGGEAALVITPNYYRSAITQSALLKHYTAVADAARIPIILYSMPDLTGIRIEPETAAILSEHGNIVGMKDSSNDIAGFTQAVESVREGFAMMIGNGTVFREALEAGASGGILAVGCVVPDLCLEIYRAVGSSETRPSGRAPQQGIDHAAALQEKLTPLARAVTKTYGIGGLKAAMEMAGYVGGHVRAPLPRPDEAAIAEIAQLFKDANALTATALVSEARS